MIYLLYGDEKFLINEEIKDIIKKEKIESISISKYDLEINTMKDIIDDAYTLSLFDERKIIIVDNLDLYIKNEKNTEILDEYVDNQNENVIIIFTASNLDNKKKIVKKLKTKVKTQEFNKLKNISNIVKKMFDDYKIDYSCVDLLIKLVGNDLGIIKSEVEKIKTYKSSKEITRQDILELVSINNTDDIFDLINYIVNKDKENAFQVYDNLIMHNEEPIKIIITLANQFRLIYQVKELYKEGNSRDRIAEILKVHPYRIKIALEKSNNYSSKILLKYLSQLSDIDYKIKNGLIDKNLALELFILNN
ncbi:MAG: DNA polymerase III subunit delta [Bacilli bacterium]|nr:DNA polymerase III subunit delta [Bacilli bacterium]